MISRRLLRIKVLKALYSHYLSDGSSLVVAQKNMMFSVNKSYDLYHLLLTVITDVRSYAQEVIDTRKSKLRPSAEDLNPNTKFIDNKVIELLADSKNLNSFLSKNNLSWVGYPELIKRLYNNMVEKPYYQEYMASTDSSLKEDKELVVNFLKNEIEDFDYIYEVLEEISILWLDDIEFMLSQAIKTVSAIKNLDSDIKLLPLFRDDEDVYFVKDLTAKAILKHDEYMAYLEKFTHNWDVERIAYMDRLIIIIALVEITEFSDIPVRVSMDEYIELTKYYSTPNSKNYVNGLLDKIINTLKAEDKINKSGRGLM